MQKRSNTREDLKGQLLIVLEKLDKLRFHLERSFRACNALDLNQLTNDELDKLEALTARFERTSDILTSHYLRLLDAIEGYEEGTLIDALNRAEKREIIVSAQDFLDMKVMRNRIAHEYATAEINEIATRVLRWIPMLLESIERARNYKVV